MNRFLFLLLMLVVGFANAAVKIAPEARIQYVDGNGDPCTGCKLQTYIAGTTTNQLTYTDSTGATAHTNPIVLNSSGFAPNGIWLTEGNNYKFILRTALDVDIWSEDNINGVNDSTVTVLQWTTYGGDPTFISTTEFTLAGDQTDIFQVNRRVETNDSSGTDYGTITSSVFTSLTTVTVSLDNGGVYDLGLNLVSYGLISALNTSLPDIYVDLTSDQTIAGNKTFTGMIIGASFTGEIRTGFFSTAPTGWVLYDDGTIGNAASGATTRANADTEDLFNAMYALFADADAPVSGGRGASAAADYAADKTITLPPLLGRTIGIAGSGASLSARVAGVETGAETHTLTAAESGLPAHTHSYLYVSGSNVNIDAGGSLASNQANTTGANAAANASSSHNNMQPTQFFPAILKL